MELSQECSKCIFKQLNCINSYCQHFYIKESIFDRNNDVFASKILARPISSVSNVGRYFDTLSVEQNKKLLRHQLSLLLRMQSTGWLFKEKIFLNIDRLLLVDDNIINALIYTSKQIKLFDLVLEVTERFGSVDLPLIQTYHRLILNGLSFATDDYELASHTHNYIPHYAYIKIDMLSLYKGIQENYNNFVNSLYDIKRLNIRLIAEKIENENDYLLAKNMPFDYFQGFYFKESNFDKNGDSKLKNLSFLTNQSKTLPKSLLK